MLLAYAWAHFSLARTHVQLGLSCQQPLLEVQYRLHVYSHSENLGNECVDHAAALGAFGLLSNHNFSTRWARHSCDPVTCFAIFRNLGDVLEKLRDIRTEHVSVPQHQTRRQRFFPYRATSWSHLLVPRSFFSVILLAQSVTVRMTEGRVEQLLGQTPRLSAASYFLTCRLAASELSRIPLSCPFALNLLS